MSQDHFPQAAAHITRVVHRRPSVSSAMGGVRASPALHPGAVTGAPHRPQGRLPKSLCLAPPSRCLLRSFRWHRPGCVPPLEIAEFEQRVLNGHGPAQVGFGFMHTSFLASPFVRGVHPAVDLVPSHCGSRAPKGEPPKAQGCALVVLHISDGDFGPGSVTAPTEQPRRLDRSVGQRLRDLGRVAGRGIC